eukprot:TRINITY_DN286_c1_g1_i1.p1 TRINITY_DN286_c1_g1~~TRINITY_DN286_c1_g1_i1.p1  ORF type:complete len:609 (+),score=16.31 TRINITY_DN286_c1_g1_i1:498-2324(+)
MVPYSPFQAKSHPGIRLETIQSIFIESVSEAYYFACREAYVPGCTCCFHKNKSEFVKTYKKRENLVHLFKDPSIHVSKMKEPRAITSLRKKYVCPTCSTQCVRLGSDDSYLQCRRLVGLVNTEGCKRAINIWLIEENNEVERIREGDCIDFMGAFYDMLEFKAIGQRVIGIPIRQMLAFDFSKNYSRTANVSRLLLSIDNRKLKLPGNPLKVNPVKKIAGLLNPKAVVAEMDIVLEIIDSIYKAILPQKYLLLTKLVITLGTVNSIVRDIASFAWDRQREKQAEAEARMKSLSSYCLTQFPFEKTNEDYPEESHGSNFLFSLNIFLITDDLGLLIKTAKSIGMSIKGFVWFESVYDPGTVKKYIKAGMCNILFVSDFTSLCSKQVALLEDIMRNQPMVSVWTLCDKREFENLFPIANGLRSTYYNSKRSKPTASSKLLSCFDIVLDTTKDLNRFTAPTVDSLFDTILSKPTRLSFINPTTKSIISLAPNSPPSEKTLQGYYLSRRKVRRTSQYDLSSMAKLAYAFHFLRDFYVKPEHELSQSLSLLDPKMWEPVDVAMAVLLFEETCANRGGSLSCMIDRCLLHNGKQKVTKKQTRTEAYQPRRQQQK